MTGGRGQAAQAGGLGVPVVLEPDMRGTREEQMGPARSSWDQMF